MSNRYERFLKLQQRHQRVMFRYANLVKTDTKELSEMQRKLVEANAKNVKKELDDIQDQITKLINED